MAETVPSGYSLLFSETSQHKRFALALRKLARLKRAYPMPEFFVRIAARRNALGQFSVRGQSYTFEVWEREEEEEEEPEEPEYAGAFDSP